MEHFRREEAQAPGDALREEEARAARVPPAGRGEPEVAELDVGAVEQHLCGSSRAMLRLDPSARPAAAAIRDGLTTETVVTEL